MKSEDGACREAAAVKPFPWYCPECGRHAVWRTAVPYCAHVMHDDELHSIAVPELQALRCTFCGEMIFDAEVGKQVSRALRERFGLLHPSEITDQRQRLGMTHAELAKDLGVDEGTIALWEAGLAIQPRAMDRFLRVYFRSAEARAAAREFTAARRVYVE